MKIKVRIQDVIEYGYIAIRFNNIDGYYITLRCQYCDKMIQNVNDKDDRRYDIERKIFKRYNNLLGMK